MKQLFKYKVATQCFTYNQKSYIKETLEGFTIQQTDFPVAFIVVDDASTDGEPDFLRAWAETNLRLTDEIAYKKQMPYGELIFGANIDNQNLYFAILLLSENHYQTGRDDEKLKYISEWCNDAEYIAICEGDDYWTDPLKLQKQVNAMSNYSNVNICAHASIVIDAVTQQKISVTQRSLTEKVFSTEEVIMGGGNFVNTNSILYRNKAPIYNFYKNYKLDYFCQINYSINAGLLFLPDVMSAYRDNIPGSICTSMDKDDKKKSDFINKERATLMEFDEEFDYKYTNTIAAHLLVMLITTDKDAKTNRHYFTEYKRGFYKLSYKQKIKVIFCSVCPSLFLKK